MAERVASPSVEEEEFSGDGLVLLPEGYLDSSDAAYELHREQIDTRVHDLAIGGLTRRLGDTLLAIVRRAAVLWLALGFVTVCV
ncbi:hypothetical protein [Lentisalinibacter sediminis]|uniref:hypothetical protein n=1 Tax=Lentisalinibacter sediminis TaxID=2992237 RepID=UPI00386CB97F